jgi:hypothetical protein
MDWIKRLVVAWVREDWDEARRFTDRHAIKANTVACEDDFGLEDPIRFELQGVIGGHLLRVRQPYNHKIDKSPSTTYIITSGEDIGARIAKIVNLELIK